MSYFVITRGISRKINVHTLLLFVHMHGFSFTVVCSFPEERVELTPSEVTCARDDQVRQRLSIMFQPAIAIQACNVIQKSGKHSYLTIKGTSTPQQRLTHHPPCFTISPPLHPALIAERAVEGPKPCFLFPCQLTLIIKVNKVPYLLLFF